MRHKKRGRLSPAFENQLLDDLGLLRKRLIRIMAYEEIWSDAQGVVQAIDRYAGTVTGNPQYFWAKHSSIP